MTVKPSSNDDPDFDFILDRVVGGGGRWQIRKSFFLVCTFVSGGLPLLLHLFTAYTPEHRCFVPGCDDTRWGSMCEKCSIGLFCNFSLNLRSYLHIGSLRKSIIFQKGLISESSGNKRSLI